MERTNDSRRLAWLHAVAQRGAGGGIQGCWRSSAALNSRSVAGGTSPTVVTQ
jgi:hypothetical protein